MEGGNRHHGHQHKSEEEAVRDAAAAAVGDDVVRERTQAQALLVLEEVVVLEEAGADQRDLDLDLDTTAIVDEAKNAHVHWEMDQEMALEDYWPQDGVVGLRGAERPAAAAPPVLIHRFAGLPFFDVAGSAAQADANAHHQVAGAVPRSAPPHLRGNQRGQDVDRHQIRAARRDMQMTADAIFEALATLAANNQQAPAPANAANNQHAAPARGTVADDLPLVPPAQPQGKTHQRCTRHGQQPAGTVGLGTPTGGAHATARTIPGKEDIISARQAILADAYSQSPSPSPVYFAGIGEEEEHDNSWYDSIIHEAQRMEHMDEPGLDEEQFQQLFPRSEEPREEPCYSYSPTKRSLRLDDLSDSDMDDIAGPSTEKRPRVLPLADDEVAKFSCGICLETLPVLDLFHGMQCDHRFCVECMATYIEGRINDGEVPIPCPDPACREEEEAGEVGSGVLHPEGCKKSIDFAAFSSWGDRLTERAIPPNQRAYCPNRQCGVLLEATGGKTPAMAFCPACGHPMCESCGWDRSQDGSDRHDCNEGPNAALVKKLAEERRWKQCPSCKMLVERSYGCDFMQCRCGFTFCYGCGLPRGRQTGMEQGAELCQCRSDGHVVNEVVQLLQHQ